MYDMNTPIDATTILDKLLQALSLSKDVQLAEFLGVSAQAIHQAKRKNKVPDGWLVRAAQKGGVSIDALLSLAPAQSTFEMPASLQSTTAQGMLGQSVVGQGAMVQGATAHSPSSRTSAEHMGGKQRAPSSQGKALEQASQNHMAQEQITQEQLLFLEDFCTVPLVAAKLSAGGGSFETEGQVLQRMAFRRDWLERRGSVENMVLMRVHGDSMEPYIQDGDLALIDTSRKNIIPHTVYAVGVDDGIYVKALETLPGQRLILRSFNERYAPIDIDMRGDLADSVRIIGKVLWWCHEA